MTTHNMNIIILFRLKKRQNIITYFFILFGEPPWLVTVLHK